jgi:predicted DNA-binding transcriptional regulator YafY
MALIDTLRMIETLCESSKTTEELMDEYGASRRTIMRMISEARNMGAEIESARDSNGYKWICTNAYQITTRGTLDTWIMLEEQRSIV